MSKNTNYTDGLVDIGKLILTFAKVNRVTLHEDGIRPESDTDHTVMLSVCACALAERLYPNLDLGKISQFATVHDLVEAYAGDTNTFNISSDARREKEERESKALIRIKEEFDRVYPWVSFTIAEYESLSTDEAQFVKVLDKIMPKITYFINKGVSLRREKKTKDEVIFHYDNQTRAIEEKYGTKFPELIEILKQLTDDIIKEAYDDRALNRVD